MPQILKIIIQTLLSKDAHVTAGSVGISLCLFGYLYYEVQNKHNHVMKKIESIEVVVDERMIKHKEYVTSELNSFSDRFNEKLDLKFEAQKENINGIEKRMNIIFDRLNEIRWFLTEAKAASHRATRTKR